MLTYYLLSIYSIRTNPGDPAEDGCHPGVRVYDKRLNEEGNKMTQSSSRTGTATSLQKIAQPSDSGTGTNVLQSSITLPIREQIEKLAYQLWEERGRPEGCADEDWLRAESRLLGRTNR